MFKKKKCERCGKKIEEKYDFCPYCGFRNNSENLEDFGMLGKNDMMPSFNDMKLPFGFNTLFNSLMKNLSKELDAQLKGNLMNPPEKPKQIKKDGISISISTFGNGPPKIKVAQLGDKPVKNTEEKGEKKFKSNLFTKEEAEKFAGLKRKEPKTNIRRLSNKVVYEIEIPGVKSLEDISIIKLENSIEIKAIAKDKSYAKVIPISLPIQNYNLSNGKLILELGIKN
ncbi:Uncharacterised protein [uncultured archaeon]|nr:Uncharacterised protein [uncultured archaeon]